MKPTTSARLALLRTANVVADESELAALPTSKRVNGMTVMVGDSRSLWVFDQASTSDAAPGSTVEPSSGDGRWHAVTAPAGAGGGGRDWKDSVRLATTANLVATRTANVLQADANGALGNIDGVAAVVGYRVLIKNQSTGADNGIYTVTSLGSAGSKYSFTRAVDFDEDADVTPNAAVMVEQGTSNGDKAFFLSTNGTITLNTTALSFTQVPSLADLASTANGLGASLIGIEDAGAFTAAADVEAALAEIYQDLETANLLVRVRLFDGILAAGTPLAAFADSATSDPGKTLADGKAVGVRWNNAASQTAVWAPQIEIPYEADVSADATLRILCSKTGATLADATTFTVTAFAQTVGQLHDADADFGGTSSAITGDAVAKTIQMATLTLTAANLAAAAAPAGISMSIKPSDGTLGTDDMILHVAFIAFKRKPRTT